MLMRRAVTALATLGLGLMLVAEPALAQKKTLVVALNQDPDILDPSLARTYVGRIIFSQMCEKLYDIDENLKIFPQLAADLPTVGDGGKTITIKLRPGVKFNDGTPMNAEAVRYSLDRHLNMKGSNRRSELESINSIDVVDALTVRLKLKAPFSPLVAILADRAGMPVSPAVATKLGDKFGTAPVCVGPWQFVERIAQDRIVLERSPHYFDKGAAKFDRLVFRIIPDDNVRLANLRSGDIDVMHLVGPTDAGNLRKEGKYEVSSVTGIGYSGLTINTGKSEMAQKNPLGKDARVREAFELSLDRNAIVQVAMEGEAQPGNQWVAPTNRYYAKSSPIPKRNVERAKQLLKEAGVTNPSFTLMTPTTSDGLRLAEVVQAMAKDAGFDIKLQATEFATSLNLADKGQFEAYVLGWSGRADPDGNLQTFIACKGPLNTSGYCVKEVDDAIENARTTLDPAARAKSYEIVAAHVTKDRPIIYLYHRNWLWAHSAKLTGLRTVPDGMVRVQGLQMK